MARHLATRASLLALLTALLLGIRLLWVGRLGVRRVEVRGSSMEPALSDGDRLLVVLVPSWWPLRPGQLVALRDPRPDAGRLMVKRVHRASPWSVEVRGDNPAASTDSRALGPISRAELVGRPVYRYEPPARAGWLQTSVG
jgi:nickel-type superoxide dismutase maturation protease